MRHVHENMNLQLGAGAFTPSPEPWVSLCYANLSGDRALYAISLRRLVALRSGFLRTVPHRSAPGSSLGQALAFG